jgi:hypothetical protein
MEGAPLLDHLRVLGMIAVIPFLAAQAAFSAFPAPMCIFAGTLMTSLMLNDSGK